MTLRARLRNWALQRLKAWPIDGAPEGSWRGPFFGIGEFGHAFQLGELEDGWQRNLTLPGTLDGRRIPTAFACVMAGARGVAQCYAGHKRITAKGAHELVTTSPAARVLRKPNGYETWPQFALNMVADLGFNGAAYAIAKRGDDNKIAALHRMPGHTCSPYVEPQSGEVFYAISRDLALVNQADYLVPARDVLHLRSYCPRHPLIGETAITAASLAAGINVTLSSSQLAFFGRMNRPSGVLSTEQGLSGKQMGELRDKFAEQSKTWLQGGVPVLAYGLKWQPLSINSQDAQLMQAQQMSIAEIARVYGVPLPVIGELKDSTMNNVEQLVNLWLSMSLGELLENIERSLDALFDLPRGEYIELDTAALLRTDFLGKVDGLTKGVQGGVFSPDEARERFGGLAPMPGGDKLYLQQQMVPLGQPQIPAPAPAPVEPVPELDDTPPDPNQPVQ